MDPEWALTSPRAFDPPLSAHGHAQAEKAARVIVAQQQQAPPPSLVLTSPYLRCVQTAAAIASAAQCPLSLEEALGEWVTRFLFAGGAPGSSLSDAELESCVHPRLFALNDAAFADGGVASPRRGRIAAAEGKASSLLWESESALQRRCQSVVDWLQSDASRAERSLVLVTHGFCAAMLGFLLDRSVAWSELETPFACISHFAKAPLSDRWHCTLACSVAHLADEHSCPGRGLR